jgi:hypothetical protein
MEAWLVSSLHQASAMDEHATEFSRWSQGDYTETCEGRFHYEEVAAQAQ